MQVEVPPARRTSDVQGHPRGWWTRTPADRRLLSKATVTLYEDVQEFWVAARPRTTRWSAAARCT